MVYVRTDEELGEALKNQADTIIIEGDLAKKVIRIRAVGAVAWVIAIGAIGVVVLSILLAGPSLGTSSAGLAAAPAAVSILGAGATSTAIAVAVAAGGVAALNRLRGYREVARDASSLHLER
jgi:hypothetical protein